MSVPGSSSRDGMGARVRVNFHNKIFLALFVL